MFQRNRLSLSFILFFLFMVVMILWIADTTGGSTILKTTRTTTTTTTPISTSSSTTTTFGRPFDPSCLQAWKERREKMRAIPELELLCQDPSTSFLQVASVPSHVPNNNNNATHSSKQEQQQKQQHPKILCVVLTQGSNHKTRLETVLEIWGYQCHRFIGASDIDDPTRYAYHIKGATEGYNGIYSKLMYTFRQILQMNITFDWILKADDDTHVIMENLYAFLESQQQQNQQQDQTKPIVYGRTMPWPKLVEVPNLGWFRTEEDEIFRQKFYMKFPSDTQRLIYVHGGPGYIMNRRYVEMTVEAYFESKDAVKGLISEDMAQSFNMLYRDIHPQSTYDPITRRERSHPESPRTMYENPYWLPVVQLWIQNTAAGEGCCSPTSISYHHMTPRDMRTLDYQLFACPKKNNNDNNNNKKKKKKKKKKK